MCPSALAQAAIQRALTATVAGRGAWCYRRRSGVSSVCSTCGATVDPFRDPVRVVDGAVVALCRACADEPEVDEQGPSAITCPCGTSIEVFLATTAVVDGAVVALCDACAANAPRTPNHELEHEHENEHEHEHEHDHAAHAHDDDHVHAHDDDHVHAHEDDDEHAGPRRRPSSVLIAAAAVAVAVTVAVVIAMRTSSGAPVADSPADRTGVAAASAALSHVHHDIPPATTLDTPEPAPPIELDTAPAAAPAGVIVPIRLRNGGDSASFVIPLDGRVDADAAETIAAFLGCRQTLTHRAISVRLLAILADLANHFEGRTIEVISAYRATASEPKTSPHLDARAADLRIIGVSLETVRDYIWANHEAVGLGYYPHSDMLHVDYRPARERIAWTQARMGAANHYHPPWSQPHGEERTPDEPVGDDPASNPKMENR